MLDTNVDRITNALRLPLRRHLTSEEWTCDENTNSEKSFTLDVFSSEYAIYSLAGRCYHNAYMR